MSDSGVIELLESVLLKWTDGTRDIVQLKAAIAAKKAETGHTFHFQPGDDAIIRQYMDGQRYFVRASRPDTWERGFNLPQGGGS